MIFQGAKWLKIQALLDETELSHLFETLGPMNIYPLGIPLKQNKFPRSSQQYLEAYSDWIAYLKRGEIPTAASLKELNMTLWCDDPNAITTQPLSEDRFLIRPTAPQLQVQVHWMGYSSVDRVFRPMVFGTDTIFWGLQWSYPQVGQDAKTGEIFEMKPHPWFVALRKWCRDHTLPTPMQTTDGKTNLPIRIGKECLSWIHRHPQLAKHGVACAV